MPRKGRLNIPGGIYHVMQRGMERTELFKDEGNREESLKRLSEGLKRTGHKCYGWVLMPNHFHLIVRTGVKPLGKLMGGLLTGIITGNKCIQGSSEQGGSGRSEAGRRESS